MNAKGVWSLAPAYDLTFSSSSQGYHSTACASNYVDPGRKELEKLANEFLINKGKVIIEEIKDVINNWREYAELSGVSETSIKTIAGSLNIIRSRF